jgi:hypothetical protein
MEAEEKQNALFDKRLAEEETWIRQGSKHVVPVTKVVYVH